MSTSEHEQEHEQDEDEEQTPPRPIHDKAGEESDDSDELHIFKTYPDYAPEEEWAINYRKRPRPNVELHPKIIEMLSATSNLFEDLWPIIIGLATGQQHVASFHRVNRFFAKLCEPTHKSDVAKAEYTLNCRRLGAFEKRYAPILLDEPPAHVQWRSWGASRCGFRGIKYFKRFCALGDVDPESGIHWATFGRNPRKPSDGAHMPAARWIWTSRNRDLVFEMKHNPIELAKADADSRDLYAWHFGLTGDKDKAEKMYAFFKERRGVYYDGIDRSRLWM